MKKLVAIALVLSLVLCLPAFALADITIVQNKPEIDAALQAYAKEYTEKTGVNVKIITGGGSTDYNTVLKNEFNSGSHPDIYAIEAFNQYEL